MRPGRTLRALAALLIFPATLAGTPTPIEAQSRFTPVIQVGDNFITRYQVDQRTLFLSLLGAPGNARELAREQLINETIQIAAARADGVSPSEEEVRTGFEEFASRANLTADEFMEALAANGVQPETFRDFITAGVAWRGAVRQRFGDTARASISADQTRRTLSQTGTEGGLRVLVSEIYLPAGDEATRAASEQRAADLAGLDNEDEFATAARRFSVSASSSRGGELNWVAFDALPPEVQSVVNALSPGQVSRPVSIGDTIRLYLLRDTERVPAGAPADLSVDYALFTVAGGATDAAAVAARVDVCDDLYGVAQGLPDERLIRETTPTSALPDDIRREIAGLDDGEISTALTRGGNATVLMLCERTAALESTVDLEIVGNRLLNTRLGTFAADHLATLRAKTVVIDLTD